jgi:hypothetical protein
MSAFRSVARDRHPHGSMIDHAQQKSPLLLPSYCESTSMSSLHANAERARYSFERMTACGNAKKPPAGRFAFAYLAPLRRIARDMDDAYPLRSSSAVRTRARRPTLVSIKAMQ